MEAKNKGKTYCSGCEKKCSGEVFKIIGDKYFHIDCFRCKICSCSLVQGSFFSEEDTWYCPDDYLKLFGKKCAVCKDYIQDELVLVLGQTYHQQCFTCSHCQKLCSKGDLVKFLGNSILCSKCKGIPVNQSAYKKSKQKIHTTEMDCSECGDDLNNGQALYALDKLWHVNCFKCHECSAVLHGEYTERDGVPYCKKDQYKPSSDPIC